MAKYLIILVLLFSCSSVSIKQSHHIPFKLKCMTLEDNLIQNFSSLDDILKRIEQERVIRKCYLEEEFDMKDYYENLLFIRNNGKEK